MVKKCLTAGSLQNAGYIAIKIDQGRYLAHRLAWLYVNGQMPTFDIDHINGDRLDNRIENLRSVSTRTNLENQKKPHSNNKTGLIGVSLCKKSGKYAACISLQGKTKHLGVFERACDAGQAYLEAKRELHLGCTI